MKKILLSILFAILTIPVLLVLIYLVFGSDYAVSLPGGYSLVRCYSGAVGLAGPGNVEVVPPNVEKYLVHDDVITGLVTRHSGLVSTDWERSKPGYFIVDIRTGKVQLGLSERSWRVALRSYGINKDIDLHKPCRFDRF